MTSTVHALNTFSQYAAARLAAASNQAGTYYNGPLNNGVGATFTYATGALTLDSVAVALGDRVLFFSQTNGYENGIWECTQAGATGVAAVLTRAGDAQCIEQFPAGAYINVYAGTALGGSFYAIKEPLPAAMGVPAVAGANNIVFGSSAVGAGLGTLGAQNANAVAITGGTITGITDLAVADGGTGSSTGPLALTALGVKRAVTAAYAGGGTSNAFAAAGLAATDIVTATIKTSTNSVALTKAVPGAGTLTVTFSADPGAATTVQWQAMPA